MRITNEEIKEAVRELWEDFYYSPSQDNSPTLSNIVETIEKLNSFELTLEEIEDVRYFLETNTDIGECLDTIYYVS